MGGLTENVFVRGTEDSWLLLDRRWAWAETIPAILCTFVYTHDSALREPVLGRYFRGVADFASFNRLSSMAAQLQSSCVDLKQNITANSTNSQTLKDNDQRLLAISQKACDIAQELISEISEISMRGQSSKRKALGKTFQAIWKKRSIDDIQKRLEQYQRLLDTQMLTNLR